MELDESKYGPLAVRSQILAASSCLLQAFAMFNKLQSFLPPHQSVEFQAEMKIYGAKMEELLRELRGDRDD